MASKEVTAITTTIGVEVPLLNTLTATEANVPTPICRNPNREEAVPAFLLKGARHKAAALGFVKPRQARKRNKKKIVYPSPYQPAIFPIRKITATNTCPVNATRMICSLLYFLNNSPFS